MNRCDGNRCSEVAPSLSRVPEFYPSSKAPNQLKLPRIADHVFLPRCLAAAKDDINEEAQWILFLSLLIPYHSPNLPLSLSLLPYFRLDFRVGRYGTDKTIVNGSWSWSGWMEISTKIKMKKKKKKKIFTQTAKAKPSQNFQNDRRAGQ